jgi:TRAP-type C4-dicarboxylate transport system substrate-binding protein
MQRSKRRIAAAFVAVTGLAALAACAPTPAAEDNSVYHFRIATIEGVGTPMNDAFERLVDEVDECSDGRLQGENYPAGQLGAHLDLIDGNRQGVYEITSGGFDAEATDAPTVAALSLGYVFKDEEHVEAVIEELEADMTAALSEATGVSVLAMGEDGWRWLFSSSRIDNIDQLQGLKIRVPEFEIPLGVWAALGASATPVPFTEVYSALETGVIDAGEASLAQIKANAFWEPAPFLTNSKHWYNIKPVRVNTEWFESLPDDLQACLQDTAGTVFAEARQQNRDVAASILEELEAEGVTVSDTPGDIDDWEKRANEFTEEYVAKYPDAGPLLERVAELAN